MKKTMNKYQRNYMLAKAHLETLRDIQMKMEHEYLKSRNIVNADGKTPEAIYCIDDENIFNTINEESTKLPEFEANWAEQLEAKKILESAENKLIEYGLSLAPAKVRETLRKASAENYTTKLKIIDLVMRLDVSTVGQTSH